MAALFASAEGNVAATSIEAAQPSPPCASAYWLMMSVIGPFRRLP